MMQIHRVLNGERTLVWEDGEFMLSASELRSVLAAYAQPSIALTPTSPKIPITLDFDSGLVAYLAIASSLVGEFHATGFDVPDERLPPDVIA